MIIETTADRELIYAIYRVNGVSMCVSCITELATEIHEIQPRSQRPKDWDEVENRVPLCGKCHRFYHHKGTRKTEKLLRDHRQLFVDTFNIILPFN